MLACPVTAIDLGTIQGKLPGPSAFPAVPGGEGVGVVTAVGSKVSGLSVNDWVVPTTSSLGKFTCYIFIISTVCEVFCLTRSHSLHTQTHP